MRRDARIVAFDIIFSKLFHKEDEFDSEHIDSLEKIEDRAFARDILAAFEENQVELDKVISKYLSGYEMERVYRVDLALIYIALTEIKYLKTPCQVAINEVIEIAKIYSTEKSPSFIHGVLAAIIKGEKIGQ